MRRIIFFIIVIFCAAGCAKLFVPMRSDTARFQVCLAEGDCGRVLIKGDLQKQNIRISIYTSVGIKVFEGVVVPDSVKIVYVYDNRLEPYLRLFENEQNRLVLKKLLIELAYGLAMDSLQEGVGMRGLTRDYCIGFLCFRLLIERSEIYRGRVLFREGKILFGGNTLTFKRV